MKIVLNREELLEIFTVASHFISNKITSSTSLTGVYLKGEKNKLHVYASNLSSYFHSSIKVTGAEKIVTVIEPRRFIEFVNLLSTGKVEVEIKEKSIIAGSGKTKGSFPLMPSIDFPLPPRLDSKEQKISASFLEKNLPLVLFSASSDEARPALTGIDFVTNEEMTMVATDGFRLSLMKTKKEIDIPSTIIPGEFLAEVLRFLKGEKEVGFSYSNKDKIVLFRVGDSEFYSRLIEGEFPPFEKVVPQQTVTKLTVETEELTRNIKLISIFARDFSNIVVFDIKKEGLWLRPKIEGGEENSAYQEITLKGEDQKVAFNYKFLLDLLSHVSSKTIVIEILRPDAPVVFRIEENTHFLHIIMPVRIQE